MLILTATAVFFADELNQIWPAERKLADARRNLPFESLTSRLPKGKPIPPTKALAAEVKQQWDEMEGAHQFGSGERTEMLKALHERTRDIFVTKPGTGFERMIPETPEEILAGDNTPGIRQPGEPAYFPASAGEEVTQVQPDREFRDLHRIGVLSFLTSRNFGYAKDRDHVAGFKPHGFRFVPKNNPLRMDHVLLVGILVHDQPVVYLTDSLPSMEQVHAAKTRPLDLFEQAGLPSLCDGEDLYIVRKEETVRMLGAIRATRTCQSCHDAEVGDLLGAFSYTLRPAPKQTGREAAPEQSK
jgi:hypothetical protein